LILHAVDDRICHIENGRFLAGEIPDARCVELEGADHLPWFESDRTLTEDQRLPHRLPSVSRTRPSPGDRAHHRCGPIDGNRCRARRSTLATAPRITQRPGSIATDSVPRNRGEHHTRWVPSHRRWSSPGYPMRPGDRTSGTAPRHSGESWSPHRRSRKLGGDIAGIAVHITARIAARAGSGEVLVSGTVRDLVAGSGLEFEDRGLQELRGVPGEWRTFAAIE
jgi:hypothetical protein